MADIILTCKACQATLKLSEYAKPGNLVCPSCRAPMTMPEPSRANTSEQILPAHVRQAKAEAEALRQERGDQPEVQLTEVSSSIHSRRRKRKVRYDTFMPTLKAAILFVVLGAALIYVRFFKGYTYFLAESDLDLLRMGGSLAILFFHLVVVIEAFTTDFFTGLFCLIIPGYSLYYLLTESDSFWLRAIVLALLAAFGLDFGLYVQAYALQAYNFINDWLAAGGEMNKPILK